MRVLYFLLVMGCVSFATAQEVVLKPLDVAQISTAGCQEDYMMNPAYTYITSNYEATSGQEIPHDAINDNCGFTQSFTGGITYTKRNCGDAALPAGETLTIPNADRQSVIAWVESLNTIYSEVNNNVWNFDQSEYRPVTNVPGAFFMIQRHKDHTVVLVMSGC